MASFAYPRGVGLALCAAVTTLASNGVARATPWKLIATEDGIRAWRREVTGSPIIEFKGQVRLEAPILAVVAVIYDHEHRHEWMDRTALHGVVMRISSTHAILYSQLVSGNPLVSDRDTVVEAKMHLHPGRRAIEIEFWNVERPEVPPVDGFIRMPRLQGSRTLRAVGPNSTEVTYRVLGHPGGWIPTWIANLIAKELPARTLQNLRSHVGRDSFAPTERALEYMFDWKPFETSG